jgi:glycosyltransferase involved in cell wall biosynthesis
MAQIAVIILTKNEEANLPYCLASLAGLDAGLFVIDCGSTDRTVQIATEFGAQVLTHEFVNHASQLNWALDNTRTAAEWILRIDADERLSAELSELLKETLPKLPPDVTGLLVPRRVQFLGRRLRWGDTYPVWLLRIWRIGKGRCEDTWMDEHILLSDGQVCKIRGDLIHVIPKSLTDWISKHNWYASRECNDLLDRQGHTPGDVAGPAGRKRWLKRHVYLRLPLLLRAFLYWFYRYVVRLGFLDGKEGLIYHFFQGFWYRFLVDAKLFEMEKARAGPVSPRL